eukprot:GDKJ01056754.1.p1 GENE.GDKJ01056754.1~~GDKJ01056754.1.p1  ORF type:complete len:506 (+),score=110.00 GDKJ01056754.1:14-1531(+)
MDTKFLSGVAIGALFTVSFSYLMQKFKSKTVTDDDLELFNILQNSNCPKPVNEINEQEKSILEEQLVRNFQHFGEIGQRAVMDSYVVIVGLGGVGSHTAISLARSGVSKLRVVDFDRVTVSSLNRHACAVRRDVGRSKSEVLTQFIHSFSPSTQVECLETFYVSEKSDMILGDHPMWGKPSFVIDAIDNIATKVDLIEECVKRELLVIVACGAGGKSDPCAFRLTDLSESKEDQLARAVRKQLGLRGIFKGVPMIYSLERNSKTLMPLQEHQEEDPEEFKVLKGLRVRTVPVIGPLPAIMGQAISAHVLCHLAAEGDRRAKDAVEESKDEEDEQIEKSFALTKKNWVKLWIAQRDELTAALNDKSKEAVSDILNQMHELVDKDHERGYALSAHLWSLNNGKCVISHRGGPPNLIRAVPFPVSRVENTGRWIYFPVLMMSTNARALLKCLRALVERTDGKFDSVDQIVDGKSGVEWTQGRGCIQEVFADAVDGWKKWNVFQKKIQY